MKVKPIFFAALAATTIIIPQVYADAPDTTVSPAANSATPAANSSDAMTALFGDPVVAQGDGVTVKRSELDAIVTSVKSAYAAQGQEITPDQLTRYEAQALEQMIDIQLLDKTANEADKADGQQKADAAMAGLLQKAGSQDTLDMQLKAAGTTETKLRAKVAQEATARAALVRELGVTVNDADVQKFYASHPSDFEEPEMAHVRRILLLTIDPATREPLPDDAVKAKLKTANDVLAQARAGGDFAKLAEQYSEDPATKDKGGDMPLFSKTDTRLPLEFTAAAFSLTNNQVSDVVPVAYGYYIIQLIAKTPPKTLTLADKIPSTDTNMVTVAEAVKTDLIQQKTQELAPPYVEKLQKAANVKILDPDLSAAVESLSTTPPSAAAPAN